MKLALVSKWNSLDPRLRAWILGALHAALAATFNTLFASPFINWKGMLAVAMSSAVTGFKLYAKSSPFPREVWTIEERADAAAAGGK